MVSECEARFLCQRLHSTFLKNFKSNDKAAYEIMFVTFLGLSPEASHHALSQPYLSSVFQVGLGLGLGLAALAVALTAPVNPLAIGAAGAMAGVGLGPKHAKAAQKSEVKATLRLMAESSHLRPMGFPAFSRILRRYCRSKELVEMCLSTLEMCSILFKKFIRELITAVEECAQSQEDKDTMMSQVNALRSQQQNRLYESGILQTFATAMTLTPATPDTGRNLLRAVNIMHGIWSARKRSTLVIPSFTVDCIKAMCARGMQTAVTTAQVVHHQNGWAGWGKLQSMQQQADLFVHSLRLLQLLLMQDLADAIEAYAPVFEEPRNMMRKLLQSHPEGIKLIYWTLIPFNHSFEIMKFDCSCAESDLSCFPSDARWASWAIFTSLCQIEEAGSLSFPQGSIRYGSLIGPSSQSTLQCMAIATFFGAVAEAVATADRCGASAPLLHAHRGAWLFHISPNAVACDKTCTHSAKVLGSHHRLQTISFFGCG
jgi:hypothetical protein